MRLYKDGHYQRGELKVLITVDSRDGQARIHMSVSREDRIPHWEELKGLREELLPLNRDFIMFFPNVDDYVNNHPHCLHLIEVKPSDRLERFIDRKQKLV